MNPDQYTKTQKPKRSIESRRRYLKEKNQKKRTKWLPEGVSYKPTNRKTKNIENNDDIIDELDDDHMDYYSYLCKQWHTADRINKRQAILDKAEAEKYRQLRLIQRYERAQMILEERYSYIPYYDD